MATINGYPQIDLLRRLKVQQDFLDAAQARSARLQHQVSEIKRIVRGEASNQTKVRRIEEILDRQA